MALVPRRVTRFLPRRGRWSLPSKRYSEESFSLPSFSAAFARGASFFGRAGDFILVCFVLGAVRVGGGDAISSAARTPSSESDIGHAR